MSEIRTLDDDAMEAAGLTREGMVRLYATNGRHGAANHYLSPGKARELAAALLRAADEAEGALPAPAVEHARNLVRDAWVPGNRPEEFSGSLDVLVHVVQTETREAVAKELEALPTTNNAADWCTNINRRQAIDTARNGGQR